MSILALGIHPVWEVLLHEVLYLSSPSIDDKLRIKSSFYSGTHKQCESKVDNLYKLNVTRKRMTPDKAMAEAETIINIGHACHDIRSKCIYEVDEFEFFTCVCNFHHPDMRFFMKLYDLYNKHGSLPCNGGLSDQPSYLMEVIEIIQVMVEEEQRAAEEKQRKQAKKRK